MTLETLTLKDTLGTRWRVVNPWAERLFAGQVFLPDGLVRERRELKRTESRVVEEVVLEDGGRIIVKRYEHRVGLEGLKRLLPHGAARIEWDHGAELQEAGLPCAEPLAFGRVPQEGARPAAEVLVTAAVEGGRELGEWWEPGVLGPASRRRLVRAFARLIRELHDAGMSHDDPHLGNFLGRERDDDWEIVPIDLRRLKSVDRLGPSGRDAHLLLIYQTMGRVASRADRLRFLSTYLEDAGEEERRSQAARLESGGDRQARRYRRRRAGSALGSNRRFAVVEGVGAASGIRWHVRRELADDELSRILENPEGAFEAPDQVLKEGGSAQVVVVGNWVVKRMRARHRRQLVLDRVRRGKALRGMRMAFLLEISDLSTPQVAAAGKRVEAGVVRRSYLISEFVPDARHIDAALVTEPDRSGILTAAGDLIGRLHAENITHRDLKAGNLLVDRDLRPWFVDLDGVRMRSVIAPARAAHDLARLFRDLRGRAATTAAEERELVDAYVCAAGLTTSQTSPLLALIERAPRLRPSWAADDE